MHNTAILALEKKKRTCSKTAVHVCVYIYIYITINKIDLEAGEQSHFFFFVACEDSVSQTCLTIILFFCCVPPRCRKWTQQQSHQRVKHLGRLGCSFSRILAFSLALPSCSSWRSMGETLTSPSAAIQHLLSRIQLFFFFFFFFLF